MTADAGVDGVAEGVGADLAGEVDLERGVDGDDAIVFPDQACVVRAIAGVEFDEGIVVDEIEDFLGSGDKAGGDSAGVDGLTGVGDRAGVVQINQAVGKHLGMDAEVLPVVEAGENGVGDSADAHLQGGTVGHQLRDDVSNLRLNRRWLLYGVGTEGAIGVNELCDFAEVDGRGTEGSRHLLIDLRNDDSRGIYGGARSIDAGAERTVAMAVRRGKLYEGNV